MFVIRNYLFGVCSKKVISNNITQRFPSTGRLSFASYAASREFNPNEKIDFEISKNQGEWKYVSRLLPLVTIPEPVQKESYPSGWRPQNPNASSPYYVRRSRNHMVPVYLKITYRGTRRVTVVRHILGDIWKFAEDLKNYVEDKSQESVGFRVDEVGCKVLLRGDYVRCAEQFLLEKGF